MKAVAANTCAWWRGGAGGFVRPKAIIASDFVVTSLPLRCMYIRVSRQIF